MSRYRYIKLKEQITIDKIYSFHYNELTKDYVYKGERHNFWEFLYVDKGELEITTGLDTFHLKQGEIVFYTPNEFHSLRCNRKVPPNIFIISFDCKSEAMHFFTARKALQLGNEERQMLSRLIEEANKLFVLPVLRPYFNEISNKPVHRLARKNKAEFGAEQLIKIYLQALLIILIRNNQADRPQRKLNTITQEKRQQELARQIIDYINDHLQDHLSVERLSLVFSLSKSHLRAFFREQTNSSLTEYIGNLKIEKAKQYIREETYTVTEIAERLGYSSIHYFSRHFKKATGVSPSEYLKTMKAQLG